MYHSCFFSFLFSNWFNQIEIWRSPFIRRLLFYFNAWRCKICERGFWLFTILTATRMHPKATSRPWATLIGWDPKTVEDRAQNPGRMRGHSSGSAYRISTPQAQPGWHSLPAPTDQPWHLNVSSAG